MDLAAVAKISCNSMALPCHHRMRACANASPTSPQAPSLDGSSQKLALQSDSQQLKSPLDLGSLIYKRAAATISMPSDKVAAFTEAIFGAIRSNVVQDPTRISGAGSAQEVLGVPTTKIMVEPFRQGRLVEGGVMYRQTFVIRSYEVGADKTASLETFLNHFQESALNHVWMSGLLGDGFGATHRMIRNDLIWVVSRMQVEVERYPAWGEVVELDTWVGASGKNGMRRDWLVRNYKTGEILARATSTWVMMNRKTRRLSKMPEEVKQEICPWFIDRWAIQNSDCSERITQLDDDHALYIHSDLQPRRSDLDMNQHVNNVKYVGWMLETVPTSVLDNHELKSITLEYRRECGQSDIVQSLTAPDPYNLQSNIATNSDIIGSNSTNGSSILNHYMYSSIHSQYDHQKLQSTIAVQAPSILQPELESMSSTSTSSDLSQYIHLLRLQKNSAEIVRGRTQWRLRRSRSSSSLHTD